MIYTVTLNPSVDYIAQLGNDFRLGDINKIKDEHFFSGGKGINVSLMLNTLGIPSIPLGFCAGFTGEKIKQDLCMKGLKTDFISVPGESRVNVKLAGKVETEINGIGPKITPENFDLLIRKVSGLCAEDYLILSGSNANGLDDKSYADLMKSVPNGVKIVVDSSGELLKNTLECGPFMIKPNINELCDMFHVEKGQKNLDELMIMAQKSGARNVLVSLGKDGARLLDENQNFYSATCPKGTVISTVGCGDSLLAAFLVAYINKKNMQDALQYAVFVGSATAFSEGLADYSKIQSVISQQSN